MGNQPSRREVIEIRKVEIVKKPENAKEEEERRSKEEAERRKKEEIERRKKEEAERRKKEEAERRKKEEEEGMTKEEAERRKKEEEEGRKREKEKKRKREEERRRREKKKSGENKSGAKGDKEPQLGASPKKPNKKREPSSQKKNEPEMTREPSLSADKFESAMDLKSKDGNEDKPPITENKFQKIARLVGITQMSPKNFVVLFIMWSLQFFVPWVATWWQFNVHILADPAHLKNVDSYLFTHEIIAFFVSCLVMVLISVFADVFNLKYYAYLVLIAIFILCPVTGLLAINYLWARGYDRPQYHKYVPACLVWMEWAMAVPFVAYPLEFTIFFTQVDNMSREAHYNYAAIFVFLDSINRLICFYVIPGNCPTLQWTLASVWIVIGVLIHTVFLLSCFLILWVKPANKRLNRSPFVLKVVRVVNGVLTKIKLTPCLISEKPQDVKLDTFNKKATPFMKKMKLILLGLVLIPVVFASFVIAIMHRLELDEDWDQHEFLSASSMFIFGRVLGVIIIAVALFALRRTQIKFLKKYSFLRVDVLALGLPHVIIVLALLLLAGRFGSLHSLDEGEVRIGPVPDEKSVIEFYNADFRNRTVCVWSEKFRPVKVGPRRRETRKPDDPGVTQFEISVTLAPRTTPPVATLDNLQFQKSSLITYVITLNISQSSANDLEALYNKFQVNRVSGTESVKPKQSPQLIIINSFMLNTSSYFIQVNQFQRNFSAKVPVPEKSTAHVMDLVSGRIDLMYMNEGTNNTQESTPPVQTFFNAENYTVWSVVLGLATALKNASNETEPYNVLLNLYKIMQLAGPDSNPLPDKRELQQDVLIQMGMCFGGIAEGGLMVGFIYLFWLDTPIGELRATTLAMFAIALAVPQQFPRLKLVDITTEDKIREYEDQDLILPPTEFLVHMKLRIFMKTPVPQVITAILPLVITARLYPQSRDGCLTWIAGEEGEIL